MSAIDELLAQARQQFVRVDAHQAKQLFDDGALLIDIRPAAQRAEFGEVPGALIVERNNLEWRLDPGGSHRIPEALVIERNNLEWRLDPQGSHRIAEATDPQRPIVVVCQEGYASSLAAASLVQLGLTNVTDLDGGFVAWKAAGLPTTPGTGG